MAARTGRLIQDQNLNIHFNGSNALGKADSTGQKKVVKGGGRKPLGNLSNTQKFLLSEDSKQLKSKAVADSKASNLQSNKRAIPKASGKSQNGSRKALADISNSKKLPLPEIRNKNEMKLSVLTEEPLYPSTIAEEGFEHNHQECVKSNSKAMDMGYFMKILGLECDKVAHLASSSELPALSKAEVPEVLYSPQHGSPVLCRTPNSMWMDSEVKFKLVETPDSMWRASEVNFRLKGDTQFFYDC